MTRLAMAVEPGMFVMSDAPLAAEQFATDDILIKINSTAKFAAVRCEILNMGYYHKGDQPPQPVSPSDGALIAPEEIIVLPVYGTNGPVADGFLPGQAGFPELAPFSHGRPIIVPYHHYFDQPNGQLIDDIYAFETKDVNSQVYDWGASLLFCVAQRLGVFLQDALSGAATAGAGGGSIAAGSSGGAGGDTGSVPGVGTSTPSTSVPTIAVVKIPLAPSAPGNFTVAHGLGVAPQFVTIQMTSGGSIWEQAVGFDATNLYLAASDAGVTGIATLWLSAADAELDLTPSAPGDFSVAHGLGGTPGLALIEMTSPGGIWFRTTPWDGTNLYLTASESGVTGKAYVWLTAPRVVVSGFTEVALAPSAGGDFTVAHGLGREPTEVIIRMTSGGNIWLQAVPYDSTNLYLTASDGGITGVAEVWAG